MPNNATHGFQLSTRVWAPWLGATAAYVFLAVVLLWPIVIHPASAWPHDSFDPALNTTILWHNAHAWPLTRAWWDLPIFWPIAGALSFSEHLLGISVLTTPLQWLGLSPIAAYNVAFICSFPLAALAAHALAFACVKRHDAAWIAGCIFGFSPYRVAQLSHVQMLWSFGMPLALMALHRFMAGRNRWWLAVFGLAWLTVASSNGYYMMFFPVLLVGWTWWFATDWRDLLAIAAVAAVAVVPLLPVLWVYSRVHETLGLHRGIGEIAAFSADLSSMFSASPDVVVWGWLPHGSHPEAQLFPGAMPLLLISAALAWRILTPRTPADRPSGGWRRTTIAAAILACGFLAIVASLAWLGPWSWSVGGLTVASASRIDKPLSMAVALTLLALFGTTTFRDARKRRSFFGFYVGAAVAMLFFSIGPRPTVGGLPLLYRPPYAWLMNVPGFSELRVPARFGMLFILALAIAAAAGFASLTAALRPSLRRAGAAGIVVLLVIESWPRVALAIPGAPIAILASVRDRTPIVELPLGELDRDVAAVHRSLDHGHPTINGYSGYDPPHYRILKAGLDRNQIQVLEVLARDTPLLVAVDHHERFEQWDTLVRTQPLLGDDGRWRLYRVPRRVESPMETGSPVPIETVRASVHNETAARMLDGDPQTAWSTGRPQSGGELVFIDLARQQELSALRLVLGRFAGEFPRDLEIDCSVDRERWNACWRGSTAAIALGAVLDSELAGVMTIPLSAPGGARYLRLRQISADAVSEWAIPELAVLGRP